MRESNWVKWNGSEWIYCESHEDVAIKEFITPSIKAKKEADVYNLETQLLIE